MSESCFLGKAGVEEVSEGGILLFRRGADTDVDRRSVLRESLLQA